jgi:histone H3/H4
MTAEKWRKCSACKNPIELGALHWVCNVSTCNRKRTGLVFCSVSCWEVHLPIANHRKAWAVEATAPRTAEANPPPDTTAPRLRKRTLPSAPAKRQAQGEAPEEMLVIASRLKDYVRARSGFNTSERVLGPLSDIIRQVAEQAMENAERDGRQTVLDRDIPKR